VRSLAEDGTWRKSSFGYDGAGRRNSVTDPAGRTEETVYDSLNRPVRVTASQRIIDFAYTGRHLTSVTIPGGKTYGFQYNSLGWLERETFPGGRSRSYAYDLDGLLVARTDRRPRTVATEYDAKHRVKRETANGVLLRSFDYPTAYGSTTGVIMKNAEVEETIHHHPESGLPYKTSYTLGGRQYVIEQVLDATLAWSSVGVDLKRYLNGTLTRSESVRYQNLYYPGSATTSRAFQLHDADGRTTTLAYDVSGRHIGTTLPNGVIQENSFNREGQRTSTSFNTVPSLSAGYSYDELGRLAARTTAGGDHRRLYHYDTYGQVVFSE
jgi:YD repeat-containing protein